MGIVHEDIVQVKEAVDLVGLITEHVPLKRSGRRYSGCCPFHEEKTPSFSVNPELGFYYCFGCHKKGDAITFMREYLNMEFSEAVEALAKRVNITLHYDSTNETKKSELTPLYDCLQQASDYYHELLMKSDDAKIARQYVRSRGLDKDSLINFQIGYSPKGYDSLSRVLSREYSDEQLIGAGLCYRNSRGVLNDVFRHRLMFPIKNPSGSTIGFGARTLDGTPPKYKNTGETKLYKKSHVLYNFDRAKASAVQKGNFVVCEGYTDVIAMTRAGITQSVATCGTASTIDHVKMMSKYVKKIVLAFDSDAAGVNATSRWIDFIQDSDASFFVANSNGTKDPAEQFLQDPQLLIKMVDSAVPYLEYLLEQELKDSRLSDTVEERAGIAKRVVEIIAKHPNELIREGYIMKYAPQLGFEPDWFFSQMQNEQLISNRNLHNKKNIQENSRRLQPSFVLKEDVRQRELLRLCVHEPDSVALYIRGDIFTHSQYREIFDALVENDSIDKALSCLSDDSRNILNQIIVEDITNINEISQYSLDVYSRVVESQMKQFLQQLVKDGADNTAKVKRLLDSMLISIDRGDEGELIQIANDLLDIKSNS